MREYLTILLLWFYSCTASQTIERTATGSYLLKWNSGNEAILNNHGYYQVETTTDTTKGWIAFGKPILPGKSSYSVTLNPATAYFRVKAVGDTTFISGTVYMLLSDSATITGARYTSTSLKWNVSNASNVSSYLIEKTSDGGKTYSKTTQVADKGSVSYTYRLSKTVKKYTYRITTIFADGTKAKPVNFQ